MDFLLTDAQKKLKQDVTELCKSRLMQIEQKVGESNFLSREMSDALAKAGLFRLFLSKEYGNTTDKPSLVSICLVREVLSRYALTAELIFTIQGLGSYAILTSGTAEQKKKYAPLVASGEKIFAFALTERNAGSDVASIETAAVASGDNYVINGQKMFISLAPDADIYFVVTKTDKEKGVKGISTFIVEKGTEGFDPGERLDIIAAHAIGTPTFKNCKVPKSQMVGELNGGIRTTLQSLDFFRTTVGASAIGLAQAALDEALIYVDKRVQFGKPLSEFQAIQMKLAAMATELEAARCLVYRAAHIKDLGQERIPTESSMAKLFATEVAQRVVDQAVQILGGYAVLKGSLVERLYRHVRPMRIYEGTSEIQHLIIANNVLKDFRAQNAAGGQK